MTELSMFEFSGIGGLIVLALDIWALIGIVGSSASTGRKVLWVLLVVLMPILGFVLWLFFGPRTEKGRA